jgi:hypothetical protein
VEDVVDNDDDDDDDDDDENFIGGPTRGIIGQKLSRTSKKSAIHIKTTSIILFDLCIISIYRSCSFQMLLYFFRRLISVVVVAMCFA